MSVALVSINLIFQILTKSWGIIVMSGEVIVYCTILIYRIWWLSIDEVVDVISKVIITSIISWSRNPWIIVIVKIIMPKVWWSRRIIYLTSWRRLMIIITPSHLIFVPIRFSYIRKLFRIRHVRVKYFSIVLIYVLIAKVLIRNLPFNIDGNIIIIFNDLIYNCGYLNLFQFCRFLQLWLYHHNRGFVILYLPTRLFLADNVLISIFLIQIFVFKGI